MKELINKIKAKLEQPSHVLPNNMVSVYKKDLRELLTYIEQLQNQDKWISTNEHKHGTELIFKIHGRPQSVCFQPGISNHHVAGLLRTLANNIVRDGKSSK